MTSTYKILQVGQPDTYEIGGGTNANFPLTIENERGQTTNVGHHRKVRDDGRHVPQVGEEIRGEVKNDKRGNPTLYKEKTGDYQASNSASSSAGRSYSPADKEEIVRQAVLKAHDSLIAKEGSFTPDVIQSCEAAMAWVRGELKAPPPSEFPTDTPDLSTVAAAGGDDIPF